MEAHLLIMPHIQKIRDVIVNGESIENMISEEAWKELKLFIKLYHLRYEVAWFFNGNVILITSYCLLKVNIRRASHYLFKFVGVYVILW